MNSVNSTSPGTLVTLTNLDLQTLALTHDATLLSLRGVVAFANVTVGDGPWLMLIRSADLSSAELEEYLELQGPLSPADIVGRERASRGKFLRTLGVCVPSAAGTLAVLEWNNMSLSGLRIPEDAGGYVISLYNMGNTMTTGSSARIQSSVFLRWAP